MTTLAVYVEKLSFRYRSLDDEPQQKRQKSIPAADFPEQEINLGMKI
jgi:hypothetical protein